MAKKTPSPAQLIIELLRVSSEAELRAKASAHAAQIDYPFFELLTAYMQSAQLNNDQAGAQTFLALRSFLGQLRPEARQAIAAIDAKLGLRVIQNREELLDKLRAARGQAEQAALVEAGYVLLDQRFFQQLDTQIEQAEGTGDRAGAAGLKQLRGSVQALKASHEARNQAAMSRATALFQTVVQSDQPDQVLRQRRDQIDEAFFVVLGANIERARRQGQDGPLQALELLGQLARSVRAEQRA